MMKKSNPALLRDTLLLNQLQPEKKLKRIFSRFIVSGG
jgi:hypothetical protein